ncbi:hypothetical protein TWF173_003168 [Orbilia oligospora]|nr:hypothetical protein TWF173_003168 [Orbilia oligospora]
MVAFYYQRIIKKTDRYCTTIISHKGHEQFSAVPIGFKRSVQHQQKFADKLIARTKKRLDESDQNHVGISHNVETDYIVETPDHYIVEIPDQAKNQLLKYFKGRKFIAIYIDDGIIYTFIFDEQLRCLKATFSVLSDSGLTLNTKKTYLGYHSVELLGKMQHQSKTVWEYIRKCQPYNLNSTLKHKPYGKVHIIPPPELPFQTICIDLITDLPLAIPYNLPTREAIPGQAPVSDRRSTEELLDEFGYDTILTAVCKNSKAVRLVPDRKNWDFR